MLAIRRWIFEMIERYSLWWRPDTPERAEREDEIRGILPDDPITITQWGQR